MHQIHGTGAVPIDGIFVTVAITSAASGYLSVGEIPSHHRSLWTDFDADILFGHSIPSIIQPNARRHQIGNTKSCTKWRQLFPAYLLHHNTFHHIFHL